MEKTPGLTSAEAQTRLSKFGLNQLPQKASFSAIKLFLSQFKSFLLWILIAASLLSLIVGDSIDFFLILIIVFLNSGLGFYQEYKASKELEALRSLEVLTSRVIRDGAQIEIVSTQIVPGDIVILESGDKIPADGRLIESINLQINEASLTGESAAVSKSILSPNNEVFFGTAVSSGRGVFEVVATGSNTKFGKIALTLTSIEEEQTPLEVSLKKLAANLGFLAIGFAMLVFLIEAMRGRDIFEVFFTSSALAVAAVPEGLPAIVTIILSIGVHKMYQKKALVRKLSSIESLGAATVICTDKTGTLTENKMRVRDVFIEDSHQKLLTEAAIYCNSASLILKEGSDAYDVLGDTTEGALLIWAQEKGLNLEEFKSNGKSIEEVPFDLNRRMMSVAWQHPDKKTIVYSKGAPEKILNLCRLSEAKKAQLTKKYEEMASKGLRVLGVASKIHSSNSKIEEKDLTFLGFFGIADAPRKEAADAILLAEKAGIRTIMITGDNELTAEAIAKELKLIKPGEEVVTGAMIDQLSDEDLIQKLPNIRIFARVVPEHKLRIVKLLQQMGEIVAVTGDGVNDSLALKQAQVGIAMGITGTDVAKEASDIVIMDDNYATIVSTIEQGRLIYSNIQKVVKFLVAGNMSEVLLISLAVLFGLPSPLLPSQILWVNFVTDGLPALALATDNATGNLMKSPPRNLRENFLNRKNLKFVLLSGMVIGVVCLSIFYYFYTHFNLEIARSYAFISIVTFQMVLVFILRRHHSIASNKLLLLSVIIVVISQILIATIPALSNIFKISLGF